MVKVTFTFDEQTVETLRRAASRLKKPQSAVVREAIHDYALRADRLSEEERNRMLRVVERMLARKPTRDQAAVDDEIAEIRGARRKSGRRTRVE
jgi:hypothetical protein